MHQIEQLKHVLSFASAVTTGGSEYFINLRQSLGLTRDYYLLRVCKGGTPTTNINGQTTGTPDAMFCIVSDASTTTTKLFYDTGSAATSTAWAAVKLDAT